MKKEEKWKNLCRRYLTIAGLREDDCKKQCIIGRKGHLLATLDDRTKKNM